MDASPTQPGASITHDLTLTADLGPCPGHGMVIEADNVTIDLGGFTVSGDPAARGDDGQDKAGILLRGVTGVTVKNGTVTGFDAGVAIMGGSGNTVTAITAQDNVNYRVVTGKNADPAADTLEDDLVCLFGEGISVADSSDNVITHNRVLRNGPLSGIALVGDSNDNIVANNQVTDNDIRNQTPDGRVTTCGTGAAQGPMRRGRAIQNIGIRVEGPGADRNIIEHNQISGSALAGISVHSHDATRSVPSNEGTVILHNQVSDTGKTTFEDELHAHGIAVLGTGPPHVRPPDEVTIIANTCVDNRGHGIYVAGRGSRRHVVSANVVTGNGTAGIVLEGPLEVVPGVLDSIATRNRGSGNGVDGSDGTKDCGTNHWSKNHFVTVSPACVATDGAGEVRDKPKT